VNDIAAEAVDYDVKLQASGTDIWVNNALVIPTGTSHKLTLEANGNVWIQANLRHQGLGGEVVLKAKNQVQVNDSMSVTTNKGPLVLWGDSDANNTGPVIVGTSSSLNTANAAAFPANKTATNAITDGGAITIGGGAASADPDVPAGYAVSNTTQYPVRLQESSTIYSGGGDISIKGKSFATGQWYAGIGVRANARVNSGPGKIYMEGDSTGTSQSWTAGISFNYSSYNTITGITSSSNAPTAITLIGRAGAGGNGIESYYTYNSGSDVTIQSLGTGGISMTGTSTATNSWWGINLNSFNILSRSGKILLDGGDDGIITGLSYNWGVGRVTLGDCQNDCGTQDYGYDANNPSTADIELVTDKFNAYSNASYLRLSTTGNIKVVPKNGNKFAVGTPFYASFPRTVASFTAGVDQGAAANAFMFQVFGALTSVGDIKIYSHHLDVYGNLRVTGAGNKVLLKTSGYIYQAPSVSVTTNFGPAIYWSNSDDNGYWGTEPSTIAISANAAINTANGANPPTTSATTLAANNTAGYIVLAGGLDTNADGIPDGYATAQSGWSGVTLNGVNRIYSGGGDITIRGKTTAGVVEHWIAGVAIKYQSWINSGAGEIIIDGDSSAYTSYAYGSGVQLGYGAYNSTIGQGVRLTSAGGSASAPAIYIKGRGSANENGIDTYYTNTVDDVVIESVGEGQITLDGDSTHVFNDYWYGLDLGGTSILSKSGDINLNGGANGRQQSLAPS
jgi:hypothetical protein